MGSNKHPLEVFRSSDQGFDSATRNPELRRTLPGKVLTTTERASPAPPATSLSLRNAPSLPVAPPAPPRVPALSTVAAVKGPPPAASPRPRAPVSPASPLSHGKKLLYTTLVLVGVICVYLVVVGLNDERVPALKLNQRFDTETLSVVPAGAAVEWHAVLAATYAGTEGGRDVALAAKEELDARGFPDVSVVGFPDPEEGTYASFGLYVGKVHAAEDLEDLRQTLAAIEDWPSGRSDPFTDAEIIPHPVP